MTDMEYEFSPQLSRSRSESQREHKSAGKKWMSWTVVMFVWAALIYGSFSLAQHYIQGIHQQLQEIRQTNQQNTAQLNQTITTLQEQLNANKKDAEQLQQQFINVESQLEAVKEEMSFAGDSLNSSDATKKALSQRITDLSKELENLRASIKKLEEAARVY